MPFSSHEIRVKVKVNSFNKNLKFSHIQLDYPEPPSEKKVYEKEMHKICTHLLPQENHLSFSNTHVWDWVDLAGRNYQY